MLHGLSHGEAIGIFKQIRVGPVLLQVGRRSAAQVFTVNSNSVSNVNNAITTTASNSSKQICTKNE
jgi:hypothetical protein